MGMNTASTKPTTKPMDGREWRRQRAWELHQAGWWQKDIAAALGVSRAAVCQWVKCAREGGGVEALRSRPHRGGPSKLTGEQRAQIPALLARGAPAYGLRGDVWTAKRIAEVIWRTFGVRQITSTTSVDCCGRRAGADSDPSSGPPNGTRPPSAAGTRSAGPPSKKASDEGYTIVWVDESGF